LRPGDRAATKSINRMNSDASPLLGLKCTTKGLVLELGPKQCTFIAVTSRITSYMCELMLTRCVSHVGCLIRRRYTRIIHLLCQTPT